jgi:ribose transport system ATP-binding protein
METLFSMKNINKRFGKVQVLKDVQLSVNKGEIHALMGENGAGKSTLMNILSGALKKDSGTIEFEGKEIKEATPEIAEQLGIGFVHQELNLAESISVAENVFMNRLPYKNKALGIIDFKELYQQTQNILNILGAKFKPTDIVEYLSTANKQLVEIAKAISLNAKVIIFDEPTTSLSEQDVEVLFIVIRALKEKGISSVYISHRNEGDI